MLTSSYSILKTHMNAEMISDLAYNIQSFYAINQTVRPY